MTKKPIKATSTNVYVLAKHVRADRTIPSRVPATDLRHLRRCLEAGLAEVQDGVILVTDAGLQAIKAHGYEDKLPRPKKNPNKGKKKPKRWKKPYRKWTAQDWKAEGVTKKLFVATSRDNLHDALTNGLPRGDEEAVKRLTPVAVDALNAEQLLAFETWDDDEDLIWEEVTRAEILFVLEDKINSAGADEILDYTWSYENDL